MKPKQKHPEAKRMEFLRALTIKTKIHQANIKKLSTRYTKGGK